LDGVVSVTGGVDYSLALNENGTVGFWGSYECGELGTGKDLKSPTPTQITRLSPTSSSGKETLGGVSFIAASPFYSLAVSKEGCLWAWGGVPGHGDCPKAVCVNTSKTVQQP